MKKKPQYVATKSTWSALNFWLILTCLILLGAAIALYLLEMPLVAVALGVVFLLPAIIQICKVVIAKSYRITFYDDTVVVKYGVFNKVERQSIFIGVYAVNVDKSFWGIVFNYGTVFIDCPGKWNVHAKGIKNPMTLKKFLETKFVAQGMTHIMTN